MPIFAFMIAEGMRRTSDKKRYIIRISAVGLLCQAAFAVSGGDLRYMNILLTYSLAGILVMFLEPALKTPCVRTAIPAFSAAAAACALLRFLDFSYGVWAVAAIIVLYFTEDRFEGLTALFLILACYSAVCAAKGYEYQFFSLLAVPLLSLYNGCRSGRLKLPRYFFYVFYPAHLAVLWLIRSAIIMMNRR